MLVLVCSLSQYEPTPGTKSSGLQSWTFVCLGISLNPLLSINILAKYLVAQYEGQYLLNSLLGRLHLDSTRACTLFLLLLLTVHGRDIVDETHTRFVD
jgi:hypothetical protein